VKINKNWRAISVCEAVQGSEAKGTKGCRSLFFWVQGGLAFKVSSTLVVFGM
jgi:hypothetical protein